MANFLQPQWTCLLKHQLSTKTLDDSQIANSHTFTIKSMSYQIKKTIHYQHEYYWTKLGKKRSYTILDIMKGITYFEKVWKG